MDWLRGAARFFEEKIGWHRLGFVLSISIIAVAAWVLYRKLHDINLAKVLNAMATVDYSNVALAALFVAGAYFTLTFYDLFALRTIGKGHIPYRIAALGGFTSYSVGHNVGATVFTGGAVRYRIYSHWGLTAMDVAKICFVAGTTFWLGNVTVLGVGIAWHPEAASQIDQLPPALNRALGIGLLIALVCYVAWVWRTPRVVGRDNWKVQLPNGPLSLLQILIGIVDLGCCALAMYMLVPSTPYLDFVSVSVIFITATLLGFISHSPGGLGVFDAAMLIALSQYDKEELLAGLLIFRLLYYITPFTLALVILGIRELSLSLSGRRDVGNR
ncbi:MAG: lysylphosphatidylglycerol synthase domain-containing protein [Pseudomonadota bacterium]